MNELKSMIEAIDESKPDLDEEVKKTYTSKKDVKNYEITEELFEKEKETIQSLNFLALLQYKQNTKNELKAMEETKELVKSFIKMEDKSSNTKDDGTDDVNFGTAIAMSNVLNAVPMETKEEMKHFLTYYDNNVEMINRALKVVEEKEEEFKSVKKTSIYLNKCMCEILDDKIKQIPNDKKYKKIRIFYLNIKKVYENRDDVTFLSEIIKANIPYARRLYADLKKANKNGKNPKLIYTPIQKNVAEEFCKIFKIEQMQLFEKHLKNLLNKDNIDIEITSFMFQYVLYISYINEKRKQKGYHKWIEALITNILDIENKVYDLPTSEIDYEMKIQLLMSTVMYELLYGSNKA